VAADQVALESLKIAVLDAHPGQMSKSRIDSVNHLAASKHVIDHSAGEEYGCSGLVP
jgi:hypothetical protein